MIEMFGTNKRTALVTFAALFLLYHFYDYFIGPDLPALTLAVLSVVGFVFVLRQMLPLGQARYLLTLAAVLLVPLLGLYGELQEEMDPDWEAWVLTPVLFVAGWALVMLFVAIFSDE